MAGYPEQHHIAALEREVAALREENERRTGDLDNMVAVSKTWEDECYQLRAKNARLKAFADECEMETQYASVRQERDQLRAEVAALTKELQQSREENAREAHLHWKAEAHRLGEENARLLTVKDAALHQHDLALQERDQLRAELASEKEARDVDVVNGEAWCERARIAEAHVAALVKGLEEASDRFERIFSLSEGEAVAQEAHFGERDCVVLLDAPDLAALVKRERVVEKLAEWVAERDPEHPYLKQLRALENARLVAKLKKGQTADDGG